MNRLDSQVQPTVGGWLRMLLGSVLSLYGLGEAEALAVPFGLDGGQTTTSTSVVSDYEVGDAPIDEDTLALLEVLTSSSGLEVEPLSGGCCPFEDVLSTEGLRASLARTLSEAFVVWPTLQGSIRGQLGSIRRLDALRIDPNFVDVGVFDPWLYGYARFRPHPSAADVSRNWVSDVVVFGRSAPASNEMRTSVSAAIVGRSADRGLGTTLELSASRPEASIRVASSLAITQIQTSTQTASGPEMGYRWGLSARGRLLGRPQDSVRIRYGYDLALFETTSEAQGRFHLAQVSVLTQLNDFDGQLTLGWMARDEGALESRLQTRGRLAWSFNLGEDAFSDPTTVEDRRLRIELGGLLSSALSDTFFRAEGYLRGAFTWRIVAIDIAARLAQQQLSSSQISNQGWSADARAELNLVGPLSLWLRYARSFSAIEAAAGYEGEVIDFFEGGPRIYGRLGSFSLSFWAASGSTGIVRSPQASLWGFNSEGAIQVKRLSIKMAVSRTQVRSQYLRFESGRNFTGRLIVRWDIPEWLGFAEVGLRTGVERAEGIDGQLPVLMVSPDLPDLIFDVRGTSELIPRRLRINFAISNILDSSRMRQVFSTSGVDVRVALSWTP